MLIAEKRLEPEHVACLHRRKRRLVSGLSALVSLFLIKRCKAVKLDRIARSVENEAVCLNLNLESFLQAGSHKRSDKALPHKLINLILVGGKGRLYPVGGNVGH